MDDYTPGISDYVCEEGLANNWRRFVFTDEVFWLYQEDEPESHFNVVRVPFVPGYFLGRVIDDDYSECHLLVAGPFPSLKSAMAASIVLGPYN